MQHRAPPTWSQMSRSMTSSVARSSCMSSPGTSSIWEGMEEVNNSTPASHFPRPGRPALSAPLSEMQSCLQPAWVYAGLSEGYTPCPCCGCNSSAPWNTPPKGQAEGAPSALRWDSPQNVRSCWSRRRGEEGGHPSSCPSAVGTCGRRPSHPGPPRSCL